VPVAKLRGLETALAEVEVALKKGKKVVERGTGANVLDSPLFALAHLVEVLAVQPEFAQLHAGEIVTTGTLTDAHPVAPGETWSTALDGLPLSGLEIHFK
jgi:2-oxo-3-hexenedioate decarboxylase